MYQIVCSKVNTNVLHEKDFYHGLVKGQVRICGQPLSNSFCCISPSQFGLLESFRVVNTCLLFVFHVKVCIFMAQISENGKDFQHAGSN